MIEWNNENILQYSIIIIFSVFCTLTLTLIFMSISKTRRKSKLSPCEYNLNQHYVELLINAVSELKGTLPPNIILEVNLAKKNDIYIRWYSFKDNNKNYICAINLDNTEKDAQLWLELTRIIPTANSTWSQYVKYKDNIETLTKYVIAIIMPLVNAKVLSLTREQNNDELLNSIKQALNDAKTGNVTK